MPGGRPTKLTPELRERICLAIRAGNYIEVAAKFAGVHKDTIYEWLQRGARASKGMYREFSDAVEKALADSEAGDVARISKAAEQGHWQAAAWRLERKFHDRWGRHERAEVKVTLTDGPAAAALVEILRRFIPDERWDEFCDALAGDAAFEGIRQTV